MNDMSHHAAIVLMPLDVLYLHPLNTRSEPPPPDIEALAESIEASGLLQNLLAYRDPVRPNDLGVVAGGGRLRALQLLAARGDWSGSVPCQVTDDPEVARLWASVENAARTELHPADEIRAYGRMAAGGASPLMIAKAFAVSERAVKQRLRLAHLPDTIIDGLRAGTHSLDQLYALSLAGSPEQLDAAAAQLADTPDMGAWAIKRLIVGEVTTATDRRAKYVTVDLYEAEGGKTTRDLFSDAIYLHDESLLNKLFDRRLTEDADCVQAEGGWGFTLKTHAGSPYDDKTLTGYRTIQPDPVDLPEGDQQDYDDLASMDDLTEDQADRMAELEERMQGAFDDNARAALGCAVYVDYRGQLKVIEGLAPKAARSADSDTADGAPQATEEPEISQVLREDFLTIRRTALQTALLLKPELLLDLVAFQLQWSEQHAGWASLVAVSADRQNPEPSVSDGLALVGALFPAERIDHATARASDLRDFRAQDGFRKRRNEILTCMFARAIMAMPGDLTDLVEDLAGADIRKVWQPNLANCFGRMGAKALVSTYVELLQPDDGDDRFTAFQAMKKKDKAKELDDLFNSHELREAYGLSRETGQRIDAWLPEIMRRDAAALRDAA